MKAREHLLVEALAVIAGGGSLDVVGDRGSGRTQFLDSIQQSLLNRTWRVVHVRGIASFRATPLAALAIAGIVAAREARPSAIAASVAEMVDALPAQLSAILIDDWDDLDEASWGVVVATHRMTGTPVVLSRLRGRSARHTPTGLSASTIDPAYAMVLPPLQFDEIDQMVRDQLQGDVEPATVSRIFTKSGGNIGLATALTDAAHREGSIVQKDGLWVATRELWSDSLTVVIEALLEPLTADLRDTLELLALLGVADASSVRDLAGDAPVEALEDLGMVELFSSGSRQLVTVRPPLLVEYFRHSRMSIRRSRLLAQISDGLAGPDLIRFEEDRLPDPDDSMAQFARLVREQTRWRALVAGAEWRRSRTRAAAAEYLDALLSASVPDEDIAALIEQTPHTPGDEPAVARWMTLVAEFKAYRLLRPGDAIDELRAQAANLPTLGAVLLAHAVIFELMLLGKPDASDLPDPSDESLDPRARAAIHRALAFLATARGEVSLSAGHIEQLRALTGSDQLPPGAAVTAGMNTLLNGDPAAAAADADRHFLEARSQFDLEGIRTYGFLSALGAMFEGRYTRVDQVLNYLAALGEAGGRHAIAHLSVTIIGAVLAARRGHRALANRYLQELDRIAVPDTPYPGGTRGWAYAQLAATAGDYLEGATICTESADALWERGASATAALGYLTALELDPSHDRLNRVRERIRSVPAVLIQDQLAYVEALVAGDAAAMLAAAVRFEAIRRYALALVAYEHSAVLFASAGDDSRAAQARAQSRSLRAKVTPGTYDTTRFKAAFIELTDRELEIARLASAGMTNQQIADELVLSVRTVESHLHRTMRKTGTERRQQLREYLHNAGLDR